MLTRRTASSHLKGEDLIAVQGSYLKGRRRERVYGHLATCAHCRERLGNYHEVDRLVRRGPLPAMDPAKKVELLSRLHSEAARRKRPRYGRPFMVSFTTVLVLIVVTVWPRISEADFLLSEVFRFGEIHVMERFKDPQPLAVPTGTMAELASRDLTFAAIEPSTLPFGFVIVARQITSNGVLDLYLQNAAGDALKLTQGPAEVNRVVLDPNTRYQTVMINETAVLVLGDPRPEMAAAWFWERDGIGFSLIVVDEPPGGFPQAEGVHLIADVMESQDEQ